MSAGDPFAHVKSGQSALDALNADRINVTSQSVAREMLQQMGKYLPPMKNERYPYDYVLVKNTTDTAVDEFQVLGFGASSGGASTSAGAVILPGDDLKSFKAEIIINGATPNLAIHRQQFVVTQEPIGASSIGRCLINGVIPALVTINDASHQYCQPKDGDSSKLDSVVLGPAQILWREGDPGDTGDKWCYVRLGVTPRHFIARLEDDIAAGASGSATILMQGAGGSFSDTALVATVWNALPASGTLPDATRVRIEVDLDSGLLNITEAYACMVP